jgi:hypothetical protein
LTVASSDGLEVAVDVDPYGVQWQAWWRPVPACLTTPEWLQQRQAWCCKYGGGRTGSTVRGWHPAGLASQPGPAGSRESGSRVWPAPLRGRGVLAVREQAARCHGADTGHVAQSSTVAGMGSPRELVQQGRGMIPRRMMAPPRRVRTLNARTRVREQACLRGRPRTRRRRTLERGGARSREA